MRLRPAAVVLAFILLVVLSYTAWWASAASALRGQVERWIAERRAEGAEIAYDALAVGGYPLRLAVTAEALSLRRADGLTATAGRLELYAEPWAPLDLHAEAAEGLSLALPAAGARPALTLTAPQAEGQAGLATDGRVLTAEVRLEAPVVTQAADGDGTAAVTAAWVALALERPAEPPADHTATGLDVRLDLSSLTLPQPPSPALGPTLGQVALHLRVTGMPPAALTEPEVRRWSSAGGTVELDALTAIWGPLDLSVTATLALDGNLQPIGAGTLRTPEPDRLVDALAAAGDLRRNQAAIARATLGLLAAPGPDGRRTVQVPVTVQDGRLTVGPVPVLTLPLVVWPAGS
ncbi:DUF2125 domain-containing protein [Rhodospirillum centenum]|uniref:DUF2125 domain-containing protein n=1 Tax=Rhodospirillum centenum (strain ATCC 51521 / SW) TaxID=414684 RepID=B6IYQ4_RHOCS|nr:DUF2125 domain-containing protein [Rhodospirillum centenum]ACJ01428.1 conserved hypothetical protein [Rhodospirillum centenum SW]